MLHLALCLNIANQALINTLGNSDSEQEYDSEVVSCHFCQLNKYCLKVHKSIMLITS